MVSSAGLSAAYGGYQKARKADNEIQSGDIQNQQAQTGLEADTAWGNTIPVLQQMLQPGATPMPPGGGMQSGGQPPAGPAPQAPPPGQPSQPMHAPVPQQAGPQPQMLGGPAPPNDPTMSVASGQQNAAPPGSVGDRFGGLPGGGGNPGSTPLPPPPVGGGAPPPMGARPPQPMPPQGPQAQQPQQQGRLDLHTIMAAVVKANPGAKPAVIAAAVAKALPLMTAQSQMDYKNLMIQLGNTKAQETATHHAATEGLTADKIQSGENIAGAKIASAEKRSELSNQTKLVISTLSNATRRDIADVLDNGRTGRAELTAASREEIAKLNAGARAEIVKALEEGRNARTDKTLASQEGRTAATLESRGTIAAKKEAGLESRQADRNLFATQRLKLQSDNLERQIKKDGTLEDNARNRQTLKLMEDDNNAEFKRAQQKIAAQNVFAPNKSKEKLTQDAETAYQNAKQRIEQYRTSMGGKGAAAEGGDQPPPEAVKSLKEGHVTTFGNGQKWTLQGGKPVRVP